MVAFAERSAEGGPTLLLSRALDPSDQDRELGEDGLYVEVCDQSRGRYGGVCSIEVEQDTVRVRFDAEAAKALRVGEYLEIQMGALVVDRRLLVAKLREIAGSDVLVYARINESLNLHGYLLELKTYFIRADLFEHRYDLEQVLGQAAGSRTEFYHEAFRFFTHLVEHADIQVIEAMPGGHERLLEMIRDIDEAFRRIGGA